eukprot:m.65124 g.65124  ORF g.65124 m.65124 type:complete len:462 (-) comp13645_c2_seq1:76-1461(-)
MSTPLASSTPPPARHSSPAQWWRSDRLAGAEVYHHGQDLEGRSVLVAELRRGASAATILAGLKGFLAESQSPGSVSVLIDLTEAQEIEQEELCGVLSSVLTDAVATAWLIGACNKVAEQAQKNPKIQPLDPSNVDSVVDKASLHSPVRREVTFHGSVSSNSSLRAATPPVLAIITPKKELLFPRARDGGYSECALTIVNNHDLFLAFKLKTTRTDRYKVRPNAGLLQPRESMQVNISCKSASSSEEKVRDRFLVMLTSVGPESLPAAQRDLVTFWRTVKQSETVEHKLQCSIARSQSQGNYIATSAVLTEVQKLQSSINELQLQMKHILAVTQRLPREPTPQPAPTNSGRWWMVLAALLVGLIVGIAVADLWAHSHAGGQGVFGAALAGQGQGTEGGAEGGAAHRSPMIADAAEALSQWATKRARTASKLFASNPAADGGDATAAGSLSDSTADDPLVDEL